ncbi:glycosyltransferase family 10 [Herbaspirillum sp. C7C8]|uniref:glycosyltransferase family 10 domain-containing protein n=1 Tax=Herbaspirillum sp. C7C8 TaxID=2736665 RepID=UPI001F521593|nr:glycosyltransferase family 10 [Herbaspirillum sp. C7C8]MCI1004464.1 hypothetical protein [Herbaspirillum sp. C7C8]
MMKLAVCNDIAEFGGNRLADKRWAARFPGAGWVSALCDLAAKRGWEVASGDVALSHVQCGYWRADDVMVIQELDSAWGTRLRAAGARPLLLTCMESPLYASLFFDHWRTLAAPFPHHMVPDPEARGSHSAGSSTGWPLRFPCYWQHQRIHADDWQARKDEVILVAANKYWSHEDKAVIPPWTRPRSFLQWYRQTRAIKRSPSREYALRQQLHDIRLEAIVALTRADRLALYGSGWDRLSVLPQQWQTRLAGLKLPYWGKIDDKLGAQSAYRFALCFENIASPGYVTEKIIEAMVARTIPIYLGAPDISHVIPSAAFIDARKLQSMAQLPDMLKSLSSKDAQPMIEAGQRFLDSEEGRLHSYEGFAQWVEGLAVEHAHGI